MTKALTIAVAILLAAILAVGWVAKSQYDNAAYLKTENKAFAEALERAAVREKRDRGMLVARQAKIASQSRSLGEAQEALSRAIQRNKEWSDTDVPDEVQKALAGGSGGPATGVRD